MNQMKEDIVFFKPKLRFDVFFLRQLLCVVCRALGATARLVVENLIFEQKFFWQRV